MTQKNEAKTKNKTDATRRVAHEATLKPVAIGRVSPIVEHRIFMQMRIEDDVRCGKPQRDKSRD